MSDRYRKVWRCISCDEEVTFRMKMNSHGCCPFCGHTNPGSVMACTETAEIVPPLRTAWTILKLKAVRALLKPIMRFHIWYELRKRGQ